MDFDQIPGWFDFASLHDAIVARSRRCLARARLSQHRFPWRPPGGRRLLRRAAHSAAVIARPQRRLVRGDETGTADPFAAAGAAAGRTFPRITHTPASETGATTVPG